MIQTELFTRKLTTGETLTIKNLETNDSLHGYSIHTIIILGGYDTTSNLTINGIQMDLPGGFVFNQMSINSITVTTSTNGVFLLGKKTKKTLF